MKRTELVGFHGARCAHLAQPLRKSPLAVWFWAVALDEQNREPRHGAMRNRAAARWREIANRRRRRWPGATRGRSGIGIGRPAPVR